MTSTSWAEVVLVVAVVAPLASVVVAIALAVPLDDERWAVAGTSVAGLGSFTLLVAGQHPRVGRFAPDDLALSAAAATALLTLGCRRTSPAAVRLTAVTVVLAGVMAGQPGRPSTVGPAVGLAVVAALVAVAREAPRAVVAGLGAASIAVAWGLHVGGHGGASAVVVGVAVLTVLSITVGGSTAAVVVPTALVLGLRVAPAVSGTSAARTLAVALAVLGAALAVAPMIGGRLRSIPPSAALAAWTLVAASGAVDGTVEAARALAAGTAFDLLLGGPLALVAAVPGAAVLAAALSDGHGWPRAALAPLAAITLIGVVNARPARSPAAARVRAVDGLALGFAVWLVVRPTSWTWLHAPGLRAYTDGLVLAMAAGFAGAVSLALLGGRVDLAPLGALLVPGERTATHRRVIDWPSVAAAALMGIVAVALVRSARL